MKGSLASEIIFHQYIPIHVPNPIAWRSYRTDQPTWFYLCDFHDMVDEVPDVQGFMSIIAKVHKESMGRSKQYGFHLPKHLANISNGITWQDSWQTWFSQAMIQMLEFEEKAHGKEEELDVLKDGLLNKVIPRLLALLESGGRSIKPCLVHSDLWSGNAMPDADSEEIIIFGSCAFWGHNEADLAGSAIQNVPPLSQRIQESHGHVRAD